MSTLSLDDATVIRRLKNHVVRCKCCQDALRNKDGLEEPTQNHPAGVAATTAHGDRNYNGK